MTWFQPPQLRIGEGIEEESRRATWLELFFDLVFVVAVSQVAHYLSEHLSLLGFVGFIALFIPVWWAWIGATLYANRFDVDDIGHRLLAGLQMLGIAAMAVNVHAGLGETSVGFALSYAAVRYLLVFQYARAARHVPSARGLATRYAVGFAIAATVWVLSAFVPIPWRFALWALGLIIDFGTPLTTIQLQARLLPHFEHLPERFGLFVIIVLGEAIIAVVNGVAEQDWQLLSSIAAVFGFAIAFSLWWIYFENVGATALRAAGSMGQINVLQTWLYGHLPLVLGIAAAGVSIEHIINHDPIAPLATAERWLICGALAMCMASLSILHRLGIIFRCKVRYRYRLGASIGLIVLAIAGAPLPSLVLIGIATALVVSQVVQDVYQGHPAVMPEQTSVPS